MPKGIYEHKPHQLFQKGHIVTKEIRDKLSSTHHLLDTKPPSRKGSSWSIEQRQKHGKTIKNHYLEKGYKSAQIKFRILERDNYTCQKCGFNLDNEIMEVDHIKPRALFPELKTDPKNLLTLCPNCHRRKSIEDKKEILKIRGHWNLGNRKNYN